MKKNHLKIKLFGVFGLFAVFAFFVSSLCVALSPQKSKMNLAMSASTVDSTPYIQALEESEDALPQSFSLDGQIYIFSENQTDPAISESVKKSSLLCWIFASTKVLETSVMMQRGEYHNFSEVATAVLGKTKGITTAVNSDGNFTTFDYIVRNGGIVYESEFSNDYFLDINNDNLDSYTFVENLVDLDFMTNIKYICLDDDVLYSTLQPARKQEIIKRYIQTYGGIYAGLGTGVITSQSDDQGNVYKSDDNPSNNNPNDRYLNIPHAVCLIGWDDGGFIALNSWGRGKTDFNTFHIPYSENFYGKLYGYICTEGEEKVSLTDAVQTEFSSDFLNSEKNLSNIFCCNEDISVTYKVNNSASDFEDIFIEIFSGQNNVTSEFELDLNEIEKVKIKSKAGEHNYGGTYLVKIYLSKELLAVKDFYVYTGADLSYVEFITQTDGSHQETDSIQLKNTFASDNVAATYYISGFAANGSYILKFYMPERTTLTNSDSVNVSELYKTTTESGVTSRDQATGIDSSVIVQANLPYVATITLTGLPNGNAGSMIDFSVSVTSTLGVTKTYYFNFFISSVSSTETHNAKPIIYNLNGGKNNEKNITRFPDYSAEPTMTSFELQEPKKDHSLFVGWYLSSDFTGEAVEYITKEFTGGITLYALWHDNITNYYDASLKLDQRKGHDDTDFSSLTDESQIVYGDSLRFLFTYKLKADLTSYNYYTRYHLNVTGFEEKSGTIDKSTQQDGEEHLYYLDFEFPNLVAGEYEAVLEVTLAINRSSIISAERQLTFTVQAKSVTAVFEDLSHTYDGNEHAPTVTLSGVYPGDEVDVDISAEKPVVDTGKYTFTINSLSNLNYTLTGENTCVLEVVAADLVLDWGNNNELIYNGRDQSLSVRPSTSNDNVPIKFTYYLGAETVSECLNVGEYRVVAESSSLNYVIRTNNFFYFTIVRKEIELKFDDISQRFTIAPNNRQKITWIVSGLAEGDTRDVLNVSATSEGLTATKSGKYAITGTCESQNYKVNIVSGTYTILGEYYVFYTLPDGTIYTEAVPDGENPKGITKDIYKPPLFSKINYSEPLVYNAENVSDLYVEVSYTNYTWVVFVVGIVAILVVIYIIASRRTRGNKSR